MKWNLVSKGDCFRNILDHTAMSMIPFRSTVVKCSILYTHP